MIALATKVVQTRRYTPCGHTAMLTSSVLTSRTSNFPSDLMFDTARKYVYDRRRGLFETSVKLLIFQRFVKKREFQARLNASTEKKSPADMERRLSLN
jgi:hypothetical protein